MLFSLIARELAPPPREPPWGVSLEAAGNAIAIETREWPSSDIYHPKCMAYRATIQMPVDVGFFNRHLMSRCGGVNETKAADEVLAELEPPHPGDPDGLGAVRIHRHVNSYFGWRIEGHYLYASRRLPDGSGMGCLAHVVFEEGRWTTRHMMEHVKALVGMRTSCPEGEIDREAGFRLNTFYLAHRNPSFLGFLPHYIVRQILCRTIAKYLLALRRSVAADYARLGGDGGGHGRPGLASWRLERPSPIFASGSASAPLRWSRDRGAGLALGLASLGASSPAPSEPATPFSLHAWTPPPPGPWRDALSPAPCSTIEGAASPEQLDEASGGPPAPMPAAPRYNEIFYDLLGLPPPKADSDSVPPDGPASLSETSSPFEAALVPGAALIRPELEEVKHAAFISRAGAAMQASLDLSLQLEAMSLADAPPAPSRDAPPRPYVHVAPGPWACGKLKLAGVRRRPEAEAGAGAGADTEEEEDPELEATSTPGARIDPDLALEGLDCGFDLDPERTRAQSGDFELEVSPVPRAQSAGGEKTPALRPLVPRPGTEHSGSVPEFPKRERPKRKKKKKGGEAYRDGDSGHESEGTPALRMCPLVIVPRPGTEHGTPA
eukprot:tig00021127_g18829.t1